MLGIIEYSSGSGGARCALISALWDPLPSANKGTVSGTYAIIGVGSPGERCFPRGAFRFIKKVFADSGYAGDKVAMATVIAVEIVRKNPDQVGFAVQPRRWVVERFFA